MSFPFSWPHRGLHSCHPLSITDTQHEIKSSDSLRENPAAFAYVQHAFSEQRCSFHPNQQGIFHRPRSWGQPMLLPSFYLSPIRLLASGLACSSLGEVLSTSNFSWQWKSLTSTDLGSWVKRGWNVLHGRKGYGRPGTRTLRGMLHVGIIQTRWREKRKGRGLSFHMAQ